jgi:hypothetical protein
LYDQSGYNRPVTQSTTANQPTLSTTGNIVYNGTSTYLVNTTPPLTTGLQKYTIIATWTPTSVSSGYSCIVDHNASVLTANQRVAILQANGTYGFCGESNDWFTYFPIALNFQRKSVLIMNSSVSTGNITLYDNATPYTITTSGTVSSLNPVPYYLNIGRKSYGSEYFTGNINEVLFFNNNFNSNDALLYYSPSLITRKKYRSNPKLQIKGVTRTNTPIPTNYSTFNTITLDSQMLLNLTSGNTITSWGGITAYNSPTYTSISGTGFNMIQPAYVGISSTSSQYFDAGSKTFNIATNGGFTAVCYLKFNSFAGGARIFDFGNGSPSDNVLVGTYSTSGDLYFHLYNGTTSYPSTSATGFATTNWNVYAFRYTYSSNLVEFIKNGTVVTTNTITGANITNKSWTGGTWIGRSHWAVDPYANWNMAGFYAFDRALSDIQLSAVSNHLMHSGINTVPNTLPDYTRIFQIGYLLTNGWKQDQALLPNGGINSYIDIQDVPVLPISYSFWFYNSSASASTIVGLCDFARGGTGIQVDFSGTSLTVYCALPTTWTSQALSFTSGSWNHLAICVGTSNNVTIYFNGTAYNLSGTAIVPRANRLILGASGDGGRGAYGYFYDFRLFDYFLRSEEVQAIYTGEDRLQLTYTSKENYLVNYYNWYAIMTQAKTNGTFYSTYNMIVQGCDPDVQLSMGISTQTSSNCIYNLTPIQNYRSFTCSFEIYSGTGTGNCFYFFVGGTALPAYTATLDCDVVANGYIIQFEEYSGLTSQGINFIDNTPVVKVKYPYTQWINSGNWVPVSISYTQGIINTWVINFNGVDAIVYSDTNNTSWLTTAGNYWGIGASNQGANSYKYIRRLELTYTPYQSSLGTAVSPQSLTKYPTAAMTANTTTLSDGVYIASASNSGNSTNPYYVFDNSLGSFWGELTSYNTSGSYTGAISTTVSGTSYLGEWIQLQLPNPINLYSYTLIGRQDQYLYQWRTPSSFVVAGSNDGSTWSLVDNVLVSNFASQFDGNTNNFICSSGNTNSYTYFRLIITKIGNNGANGTGGVAMDIAEWSLFSTTGSVTSSKTKVPIAPLVANSPLTFTPVTIFTWFNTMYITSNSSTFYPILQPSNGNPVQIQMTPNGQGLTTNLIQRNQPVQNYPFTLTFQIYCVNNSSGDNLNVYFGSGGTASAVNFNFQIYGYAGIRLFDSSGTQQAASATNWYNSAWREVRIVYTATATNTWTMYFDGTQIIQYSDPNFWNLIMNGGTTWGFYAFNGAAQFTAYLRQINMDFNINNTLPNNIPGNSILNGNYTVSASNTRTDRAAFPYFAFDNASYGSTAWAYGGYNITTGAYTGSVTTTVSGVAQAGEWLQIQLPNQIIISSFTLLPYFVSGTNNYVPRSFVLAGSNDGSTWDLLYDNGNPNTISWTVGVEQNFIVNNNGNKYKYYRLIIRATGTTNSGGTNQDWIFIDRFDLFTPVSLASSQNYSKTLPPTNFGASNTLTVTTLNSLLNGTYTASATSYFSGGAYPYLAFQGYPSGANNCWTSSAPGYGVNGNYAAPFLYWDIGNSSSYPGSGSVIYDISGNGYNYGMFASPTYASNAITLNGTSQYLCGPVFSTMQSGSYSIEIWINPSSNGVIVDETTLVGWHTSTIELVGGVIYAKVYNLTQLNLGAYTNGNWYQIVLVYDGSTEYGYVNGSLKASAAGTRSAPGYPVAYFIGNSDTTNFGNGGFFSGKVQTFLMYNTNLTATQVLQNYNYFSPRIVSGGSVSGTIVGPYTTIVSNVNYTGEWLQLQVPNPQTVYSYTLTPQQTGTYYNRAPTKYVLAGSNDGTTWFALDIQTSVTWSNASSKIFVCNQNNYQAYTYFRLVVQAISSSSDGYASIGNLTFNTNPPPPRGLMDGLTYKIYNGTNSAGNGAPNSTSYYSSNPYISIGRCTDTTNYRTITNGFYVGNQNTTNFSGTFANPTNCSTELFGYFRPNVTGTWTFYLNADDGAYLWIGNNALSGYTSSNYTIQALYTTSGVTSASVSLIAGVYYPIRVQHTQATGGVNLQLSFSSPYGGITSNGQGFFFSGTGTNSAYPQENAKIIKDLTNTNTDGVYYILCNGISTPTYCLMNDIYDGGGWMMLMKATPGSTFNSGSDYWSYVNTLNANDTTRNNADAKYNTFNYVPIKDLLAIWPDINPNSYTNPYGNNGGSFYTPEGWTWLLNNWYSGSKTTALAGFSISRPAGIYTTSVLQPVGISNPFYYNGYGTCFSNQTGSYIHYINAVAGTNTITGGTGAAPGTTSCNVNLRWGFIFNNETTEFNSSDAYCGIGISGWSAGDAYGCCGTAGINRQARVELYGR